MPSSTPTAAVEAAVQAACQAGNYDEATTLVLRQYGAEILAWLSDRLRRQAAAADAFSLFAEDLWKSWSTFEWRCSARAWTYTLARNAANRYASNEKRHRGARVPLSLVVERVVEEVVSSTRAHLKTDVKDRVRQLRTQLSEEDQTILVLRVDRRLPWIEIAQVMTYQAGPEHQDLDREAARLRKRFQRIKDQLRDLAEQAGLLKAPSQ